MFTINDCVVHKTAGVCIVNNITLCDFGNGQQSYYFLVPKYPTATNKTLEIYLPIDKAENFIRKPIDREKAELIIRSFPQMDIMLTSDSKTRKAKIEEIYHLGDFVELCRVVKLLYKSQNELPHPISPTEKTLLMKIKNHVFDEFAVALDIMPDKVEDYIANLILN